MVCDTALQVGEGIGAVSNKRNEIAVRHGVGVKSGCTHGNVKQLVESVGVPSYHYAVGDGGVESGQVLRHGAIVALAQHDVVYIGCP